MPRLTSSPWHHRGAFARRDAETLAVSHWGGATTEVGLLWKGI